jgi:trimethylamine--corrinoid protein Co-methyltransferase
LEEGAKPAEEVANAKFKQLLRDYEAPELDPAIEESLQAFMAQRKAEIPPEF